MYEKKSDKVNSLAKVKILALLVCLGALTSCATPIGQFKESDLTWTKFDKDVNYQEVFRNLKEGFRRCAPGLFADGNLYTDIKEGHFDIYVTNILGGRSQWVYGIINIRANFPDGSTVDIGVKNAFDNPVFGKKGGRREMISGWASKNYDCE
jgi:hypothetical protein